MTFQMEVDTQQNCALLQRFLDGFRYFEGWSFTIKAEGGSYVALVIHLDTVDSRYPPSAGMTVRILVDHYFQVPWFTMSRKQLERWVLDNIMLVHRHEAMENFKVYDPMQMCEVAPFYPEHAEPDDPPTRVVNPYRIERTHEVEW